MSEIDKLVDQLKNRKIDRRQFVLKGAALGVSFTALGSILAACGGGAATPAATATATAAATETATAAATTAAQETVKIVVTSPQTGGQATWGTELIRGTELALGDYDAAKLKFKYEIVPYDDQADPKVGMTVANKVAADKDVMAVVGPWNSGVAIPASPVYNQARVPLFAVASDPKLTHQGFDNIFRVGSTNDFQAIGAEAFVFQELKKKKVAMIYEKTIPGQGLADFFKTPAVEDGMEVVAYEGITVGDKDFTAVLTSIKPKNPDVIWMPATFPEGSQVIKQMKDLGFPADVAVIGADGMYTDDVIKIAGAAAEGVYATALGGDVNKMDTATTFVTEFKGKYNEAPQQYSVFAYVATHIFIDSMEKIGTKDKEALLKQIRAGAPYKTALGDTSFNKNGDTTNQVIGIFQIKNGKWDFVKVAPIPAARMPQ